MGLKIASPPPPPEKKSLKKADLGYNNILNIQDLYIFCLKKNKQI